MTPLDPIRRVRRALRDETPRPFVAFAATDERSARRLYRAQNLVWIWLGLAAILGGIVYLFRPTLGPVVLTRSPLVDDVRQVLLSVGGLLIANGVWWVRRALEIVGHAFFASGALLSAVAVATIPGSTGVSIALLVGIAVASAYRAYYIVRWIGAADVGD